MKKQTLFILITALLFALRSAGQISIHQEESERYRQAGISADDYENINIPLAKTRSTRAGCNLNKIVYGWHPYWSNGLQANYDWNLLSHFSYFSYELDAATGNAISTHSFSTAQAVTDALNNGVRVDLCVTLFSNHATFLNSTTSRQTLITNLINLISARGAHGVNIDFEGLPSSQATNFRNFMNDLANQMHAAIPGSQVSTVLYSVDWNNALDVANMTAVDHFIIMGYDYYYSGSTTAGPNDPLYHFGNTYNYTLSKSVTYYLDKGVPEGKLVLGLPYYGREWAVSSFNVPATATATGVSRTYTYVRTNSTGFYSSGNRQYEPASKSTFYNFTNAGSRQCYISEANDLRARLDFINKRGIAGMGIWALGYDDGYNEFWSAIEDHFTDCADTPCSDTLTDIGGGRFKNYYDNEDYIYTIAPANAASVSVTFSSFSLENNYDFLYVYDGASTSAPQVAGSPFTGTVNPGTINSSGGALTFRFTSDGSTTAPGFVATYQCVQDNSAPTTAINVAPGWKSNDFNATFVDQDMISGISERFWIVMDNNGTEWRANADHGFFNDNFDQNIHPEWSIGSGSWSIQTSWLNQSDQNNSNTALNADLQQQSAFRYLYHWSANMSGSGTNRRSGIHFFCDDPTLPNRGNSYLVYFRVDNDKCQIYEIVNDVITLRTDDDVVIDPGTWYDYKVSYDPASGKIIAYVNDVKVSEWIDTTPLQNGNSISLRTGNVNTNYNDLKVYRSRGTSETLTIGSTSDMIRYQNNGPANASCRIRSIVNDQAGNWSASAMQNVNIDWTAPSLPAFINDGSSSDIDTSSENLSRSANWASSSDPHSDLFSYEISIGNSLGDSSVHNWVSAGNFTSDTITGIVLNYGQTYFLNLRAVNGAGLRSALISSDGFYVLTPASPAIAAFQSGAITHCATDSLTLQNLSGLATSFQWQLNGLQPGLSNTVHPSVYVPSSGNYQITLIAYGAGGNDTITQTIAITLVDPPLAAFTATDTVLFLPNAFLSLSNDSQNANSYQWSFGDSTYSTDSDPWHLFSADGSYLVQLTASNGICAGDTAQQVIYVQTPSAMEDQEGFSIRAYPNPASDHLIIENDRESTISYSIYDALGKEVMTGACSRKQIIEISALQNGTYFIRLVSEDFSYTQQFIKI